MEEPVQFSCNGKSLYGIFHKPDAGHIPNTIVIIVIGGSQIRIGGHRLYLQLARFLCMQGVAVLRFDYEGMGDSQGDYIGFEEACPSIEAAVSFASQRLPAKANIILWSLCSGSSACAVCAGEHSDKIEGLILCNPYLINDEQDKAKVIIKHYYMKRFFQKEFWINLLLFRIKIMITINELFRSMKTAYFYKNIGIDQNCDKTKPLSERFVDGVVAFDKPVYFILSTNDIVAKDFNDLIERKRIKRLLARKYISLFYVENADHTFTDPFLKNELFEITLKAVNEIAAAK